MEQISIAQNINIGIILFILKTPPFNKKVKRSIIGYLAIRLPLVSSVISPCARLLDEKRINDKPMKILK
jgi:hypothetical protein